MPYSIARAPRHDFRLVRGLRHRLTWWGAPSAAPIVLLHGFMDCGATWQFLVDHLPQSWSCVAPDWRGFGGSDWAPGGYWFPDYLADLDELLDSLVPDAPARIIGHSMGANIAALYAGVRPRRLQWLINLEGVGLPRTAPEAAPARYEQWLQELRQPTRPGRYAGAAELARVLQRRNPRLPAAHAAFVANAWTRPVGEGEVELRLDPRHRLVNPVLYRLEEAHACWSRIEIPLLLITGAESQHNARRYGELPDEQLHTLLRDLRIVELAGVGHMMHHEDPLAVAATIREFVRGQP
ncbi:MAG TPA: alpha/beta hydrolase [Steroidobacteraceae bacterium]